MNEYDSIVGHLGKYVELSEEEKATFTNVLRKAHAQKRQFIVQPGFICTHQTYVVKGALRLYLATKEGLEHTLQFAVEDWWISDFNSYIQQEPASLFVEALEPCEIWQLSYQDAESLCKANPKFEHFFRMVAQKSFAFAQRRVLSNLSKSAEERYDEFYTMYPDIVRRVPQYMLASYLGMTPEFLSKIRRRQSLKKS